MSGFKPIVVSKMLDVPLDTVYYNNRALKRGKEVLKVLELDILKERINNA